MCVHVINARKKLEFCDFFVLEELGFCGDLEGHGVLVQHHIFGLLLCHKILALPSFNEHVVRYSRLGGI